MGSARTGPFASQRRSRRRVGRPGRRESRPGPDRSGTRGKPGCRPWRSLGGRGKVLSYGGALMTDDELRTVLAGRIAAVHARIAAACTRVNRGPAGVTLVAVTKAVS